jgi:hypothetical protein
LDLHFLLTFALKYKVAFSIEYEELHWHELMSRKRWRRNHKIMY